jgi:hypothetical protein
MDSSQPTLDTAKGNGNPASPPRLRHKFPVPQLGPKIRDSDMPAHLLKRREQVVQRHLLVGAAAADTPFTIDIVISTATAGASWVMATEATIQQHKNSHSARAVARNRPVPSSAVPCGRNVQAGYRALSPAAIGGESGAAALPQRRQAARKVLQHVHLPPGRPHSGPGSRPQTHQHGPSSGAVPPEGCA